MPTIGWVAFGVIAIIVGGIGMMKLVGIEGAKEQAVRLGYDRIMIPIGIAEVLGVAGLAMGAFVEGFEWLGTIAAVGIIVMMIGAFTVHLRAGDKGPAIPSLVVIIACGVYLVSLNGA